ncbi:MAG: helix-turn-helix domain-containing protein [Chloroflexi bacterium]|nr:helix-turn-helix domain-containing protein [Chloroflexota bacterium]
MPRITEAVQSHWLSLGAASRVLGINQATLRSWADQGRIRAYRTPGGHRRFSREDVEAITRNAVAPQAPDRQRDLGDLALRRIRRRLHGRSIEAEHWHEQFDDSSLSRMRLFGRRLLTLTTDYIDRRRRRPELLEEARFLGQDYGQEMVGQALSLEDAIRAFGLFRTILLDGLQNALGTSISSAEVYSTWQQVNLITDEVLESMVRVYQQSGPQTDVTVRRAAGRKAGI